MFPFKSKEKVKKMDILITSVVLGTIIAGAFGLKKKSSNAQESAWKKALKFFI